MPTKRMNQALSLYAKYFQVFKTICVHWDSYKKKFRCIPLSSREVWLWIFNVFIVVGLIGLGNTLLCMLRIFVFGTLHLPWLNTFAMIISVIFGTCAIGVTLALILYGEDFVEGWNHLDNLESRIVINGKEEHCNRAFVT